MSLAGVELATQVYETDTLSTRPSMSNVTPLRVDVPVDLKPILTALQKSYWAKKTCKSESD